MAKKFNLKKGIAGTKKEAKKMPKRVYNQLGNASLFIPVGGATVAVGRAVAKSGAKKAAKKIVSKVPKKIKVAGQKKKMQVKNNANAVQSKRRTRKVKFKVTRR